MVKKKKIESKFVVLKDEYPSMAEFIEAIPENIMIFKKKVEINNRATGTLMNLLILVYEIADERNSHFSERTLAYMRETKTGKIYKVDQERLRRELGELLMKQFSTKSFMDDFVVTLTPMELIEAYDRAIVKKGKVKQVEGCSKFLIYGQNGSPMQLMLRN